MIDQGGFQVEVEPQQANQVWGLTDGTQLGSGRHHPQGQHALDDPLRMLHFLHGFAAKALCCLWIAPKLHKGALGHVLLHSREFKAQGATEITQDARMNGAHGNQRRRVASVAIRAGSTSLWGRAMMWAATRPSPTRSQASAPALTAALTAPVSPRTITVT